MRLKFLILTLVLIIYDFFCFAQYQDKTPQVKPIPPDAAAMFKVLERPIGTYTGTVPVNFPLYTLSSGTLSANISLNYNSTGGIRVEELASSAGLGFSLADGAGRITQLVRDKPDDQNGLINTAYTKPSGWNCGNMNLVDQNARGQLDLEPDVYMYNFNGRSGKFFLKENGAVVLMENSGIKIEYSTTVYPADPRIRQWIITDENGNKYYYGQNKTGTINYRIVNMSTYMGTTGNSPSSSVSSVSWFLTEAYDMNEENSIKYTYTQSGDIFTTFSGGFMPLDMRNLNCTGCNTIPDYGTVTTSAGEYVVTKIEGNNGYILFNTSADRLDGPNVKLNAIQIYDSSGAYKKSFKFNYGYFSEVAPTVRRLKLKNFSEFGTSATDSITHKFEYEELQNLPERLSASVDFWGFYNGVYNSTYFPNVVYQNGGYTYRNYNLADRNANGGYAIANILKKIIYPTGGYREFVYEGNTALYNSILSQYHPDPDYTANQSFIRTDFTDISAPYPCLKYNFTVNSADGGSQFRYVLDGIGSLCDGYAVKLFLLTDPNDPTKFPQPAYLQLGCCQWLLQAGGV
jgi:hypothetical protein